MSGIELTKQQKKSIRTEMFSAVVKLKFNEVVRLTSWESVKESKEAFVCMTTQHPDNIIAEGNAMNEYAESQFEDIKQSVLIRLYRQVKSNAKKAHIRSISNAQLSIKRVYSHVVESGKAMGRELDKVMSDDFQYDGETPKWVKEIKK